MEVAELEVRVTTKDAEAGQKRLQIELDKTGKVLDRVMASAGASSPIFRGLGTSTTQTSVAMRQAAQESVNLASAIARQQIAAGQTAAAIKTLEAAIHAEGASTKSLIALETQLINARRLLAQETLRTAQATTVATASTVTATNVGRANVSGIMGARSAMVSLRSSMMILGMQAFPQLSAAMFGSTAAASALKSASLATGLSIKALIGPAAAATASVIALVKAFQEFQKMREAEKQRLESAESLQASQVKNANRLVELMEKAQLRGFATANEVKRLTLNLMGASGNADTLAKAMSEAGQVVARMNAADTLARNVTAWNQFVDEALESTMTGPARARAQLTRELDELLAKGTELAVAAGVEGEEVVKLVNTIGRQISDEIDRAEKFLQFKERLVKGGTISVSSGEDGLSATMVRNRPIHQELGAAQAEMAAAGSVAAIEEAAAKIQFITQEMNRKMQFDLVQPQEAFIIGWQKAADSYGSMSERIGVVGQTLSHSIDQNLTDGLMGIIDGTKSVEQAFSEMSKAIIMDLIRVMIQQLIVRSLMSAFGGTGGVTGGIFASTQHEGGMAGSGALRGADPTWFDSASRYAGGGMAGDEVPIIAHRGEVIFNEDQFGALLSGMGSQRQRTEIINVTDPRMIDERLAANPNAVLNVISRNRSSVKVALGIRG